MLATQPLFRDDGAVLRDILPASVAGANIGSPTLPFDFIYANNIVGSVANMDNNEWLKWRNAANSAYINTIKVDATDDVVVNASTGNLIKLAFNETANVTLAAGSATFASAAYKVIPGATSFTFRNNADSADNLSITDAGVVTLRSNLVFAAAAAKIIPGATSLTIRNTADAADNLSITNAGLVTIGQGNLALTAGNLVFAAAAAKIIPGATSLSFRNAADSADNILIADAGTLTIRGSIIYSQAAMTIVAANTTSGIQISAGNGVTAATGGILDMKGSTAGVNPGDVTLSAGTNAGGELYLNAPAASSAMFIQAATTNFRSEAGTLRWSITSGAVLLGAAQSKVSYTTGGASPTAGTFVANGATNVVVTTTAISVKSIVIVSLNTIGGTVGERPHVTTITAGTSFTVAGTAGDTSTYNWAIVETV